MELCGRVINLAHEKSDLGHGMLSSEGKFIPFSYDKDKYSLRKGDIVFMQGEFANDRVYSSSLEIVASSDESLPNLDYFNNLDNRIRNRHLSLMMNPESVTIMQRRNELLRTLRQSYWNLGFEEVETGVLKLLPYASSGESFVTHQKAKKRPLYLRKTTEVELRKLIIAGFDKVFELGKNFRNEGKSHHILNEFISFDLVQANTQFTELFPLALNFLNQCLQVYGMAVQDGFDVINFSDLVEDFGFSRQSHTNSEKFYYKEVEPKLDKPTIVTNFPDDGSPLVKLSEDTDFLADFRLVYRGFGYLHGHNMQDNLESYIERENRQIGTNPENFDLSGRQSLRYGMPSSAGFSAGIDRIIQHLSKTKSIRDCAFSPI